MSEKRAQAKRAVVEEFGQAYLGDERLSERLEAIARGAVMQPSKSLPQQSGSEAALLGAYRFLKNLKVTPEAILSPHIMSTVERCATRGRVIVAHDTTDVSFEGREEFGPLSGDKRGFRAHFALAISVEENREPLGVLHLETIVREDEPGDRKKGSKKVPSESLRWNRAAAATHDLLGGIEAIHVFDSEADIYALMAEMAARGQHFVVRACHDRRTDDGSVSELLKGADARTQRSVKISARKKNKGEKGRKRHPARAAREATLEISTTTMLLRANVRTPKGTPETLELNLVRVLEVDAPDGETPVEWWLWTNLPIRTREEVLAIVDAYRGRWVIEEYFKALKEGCALEKRQLESPKTMFNALAIFAPIAWTLLRLRSLARSAGDQPQQSLSKAQLICLRFLLLHLQKYQLPPDPTEQQTLTAIARLGGHITSNGEPGWQVLGRGLDTVHIAELGYAATKNT
jgi:hypothetical protein